MHVSPVYAELGNTGVLVVAYRRFSNLEEIILRSRDAGIQKFFIHIDRPNPNNFDAELDHQKLLDVLETLMEREKLAISMKISDENQGCAVSVISGVNWAFSHHIDRIIVLEDDCLPTQNFFDFYKSHISEVEKHEDFWLLCGTQFAPKELTKNRALASAYALTWGWATSREKWKEIHRLFITPRSGWLKDLFSLNPESSFWNAGARRALSGFTDVWDTVLIQGMQEFKKFSILPPYSLVSNVGNDSVASHVSHDSPWTKIAESVRSDVLGTAVKDEQVDVWLKVYFYKIRGRHLLSTKITLLLDFLLSSTSRKHFRGNLSSRIKSSWIYDA
jgi:GR25 family glycosyltransferase involved in LPS biosynthesis